MEIDQGANGLSRFLGAVALVFIGVFLVGVCVDAVPLALLDPRWQLRLIGSVNGNAGFLITGFAFLMLAAHLLPDTAWIQSFARLARRWAAFVALLFLLLVPLQLISLWRIDALSATASTRQQAEIERRLGDLRAQISAAGSNQQIQERLQAVGAPPLSPLELAQPTPELKKRVLATLGAADADLRRRVVALRGQSRSPELLRGVVRSCLLSLLFGLGFAAGGRLPGSRFTLLEELQRLISVPQRQLRRFSLNVTGSMEDLQERRRAAKARRIRERLQVHRDPSAGTDAGVPEPEAPARSSRGARQSKRTGFRRKSSPAIADQEYIRRISEDGEG